MSLSDRIADMNTISGFLVPVYSEDPLPGREVTHALTPTDMEKVRQGYACAVCLADFGAFYRVTCPMCQHERNLEQDFAPTPDMWVAHLREKQRLAGTNERTVSPMTMDQAIRRVHANPDIDHATMKQLKPPRWGAGRT